MSNIQNKNEDEHNYYLGILLVLDQQRLHLHFSTNTKCISIGSFFEQWHKQHSCSLARSFKKQSIPRCYTCFGNKLATTWTNDWPVIEHRFIAISPIWLLCLGQELCPWIILILAMLLLFFGPIIQGFMSLIFEHVFSKH